VAVLFQVALPDVRSSGGGFGRGIFSVRVSVVAGIHMRRRPVTCGGGDSHVCRLPSAMSATLPRCLGGFFSVFARLRVMRVGCGNTTTILRVRRWANNVHVLGE
jgi:hypothetical protein